MPFVFLGVGLLIAGCGGTGGAAPFTPNLTTTFSLTSQSTILQTYGAGTKVSGWNRLTGPATITWVGVTPTASVEFLGSVAYTSGTGPFFGIINITTQDGDLLAIKVDGTATLAPGTTTTTFVGTLKVLGGNVGFANTTGTGTMSGTRDSALGGAVNMTLQLQLKKP